MNPAREEVDQLYRRFAPSKESREDYKKRVLLYGRDHDPLWKCIAGIENPSDEEFLEELRVNGVIP